MRALTPVAIIAALACMVLSGCVAPADPACERWRAAAEQLTQCSPGLLPPVDDATDVVCLSDAELADGGIVTDLDECVAYFEDHLDPCEPLSYDDPRTAACTYGAVSMWRPTSEADPCERWKIAARDRWACDPDAFSPFPADAECISDAELAATGGPFETVRECADFLLEHAYPCEIPLGEERTACAPSVILRP